MARKAKLASNEKRAKLAEKYAAKRAELRNKIKDVNLSEEERFEAMMKLQTLPRNSAKIRVRNRCVLTGRPRGNYRKFGLSRIAFRELALRGMIPGVTKSSW
ncbi:30S ribosomal protein S14 [Halobacteriovorax sp. GB3]|uniref:30S ribosomal protein S14 n=1 Tax=Halobacteriovorax sp. GB3 TaxID=2719615 RepID=UPI00235E08DE|nr:30S ribosomal protein S14 [Halobacteriovorax sp. GB3]MDD0854495.1 30S ribosomal protein S14 [Halobacteriovorax sp. GB3]